MNEQEHLLATLAEEGGEIAYDCTKSLRFGLNDTNVKEPNGPNNRERLISELNDLIGVVELMVEKRYLPYDWLQREKIEAKKEKVRRFMDYARSTGALQSQAILDSEALKKMHPACYSFALDILDRYGVVDYGSEGRPDRISKTQKRRKKI